MWGCWTKSRTKMTRVRCQPTCHRGVLLRHLHSGPSLTLWLAETVTLRVPKRWTGIFILWLMKWWKSHAWVFLPMYLTLSRWLPLRAQSYAERLRLGLAVIHGEAQCAEMDMDDGRHSPPMVKNATVHPGLELPCKISRVFILFVNRRQFWIVGVARSSFLHGCILVFLFYKFEILFLFLVLLQVLDFISFFSINMI